MPKGGKRNINIKKHAIETNTEHTNKLTKCMKKCVNKSLVTTEKERNIKHGKINEMKQRETLRKIENI